VDLNQLASLLAAMGCPAEKAAEMASQLDKRARQLLEQKGRSYDEALAHLLNLMKQGWAAQGTSFRSGKHAREP
jgi:hypothetical protein